MVTLPSRWWQWSVNQIVQAFSQRPWPLTIWHWPHRLSKCELSLHCVCVCVSERVLLRGTSCRHVKSGGLIPCRQPAERRWLMANEDWMRSWGQTHCVLRLYLWWMARRDTGPTHTRDTARSGWASVWGLWGSMVTHSYLLERFIYIFVRGNTLSSHWATPHSTLHKLISIHHYIQYTIYFISHPETVCHDTQWDISLHQSSWTPIVSCSVDPSHDIQIPHALLLWTPHEASYKPRSIWIARASSARLVWSVIHLFPAWLRCWKTETLKTYKSLGLQLTIVCFSIHYLSKIGKYVSNAYYKCSGMHRIRLFHHDRKDTPVSCGKGKNRLTEAAWKRNGREVRVAKERKYYPVK